MPGFLVLKIAPILSEAAPLFAGQLGLRLLSATPWLTSRRPFGTALHTGRELAVTGGGGDNAMNKTVAKPRIACDGGGLGQEGAAGNACPK